MARNSRCVVPGVAYHVTQRGTNKQQVFLTFGSGDLSGSVEKESRVHSDAPSWCLITNHVHLALVPEMEDSLEVLLRRVHSRYAQMVNARRLRTGYLWQNRFFSCPLLESHLRRALAYIEHNPVRAGLVSQPE